MMKTVAHLVLGICLILLCVVSASGEDRLKISVKINGKDATLAFDTGADVSLLVFQPSAKRLHLAVNEVQGKKIATFDLEIKAKPVKTTALVIDSLPFPDIDGMIGLPGLQGKIWSIRWDKMTVSKISSLPADISTWQVINLATNVPIISFRWAEQGQGLVYIDTGDSGGIALSQAHWEEWLKDHQDTPMTLSTGWSPILGGLVVVKQAWANRIHLGPLTMTGTTVTPAMHKWKRLEGVIGLQALSCFEVILDLRAQRIYLKRRPDASHIIPKYNHLGATFCPSSLDADILTAKVLTNSPAYRYGIREGDILLRVDDTDMTKWKTDPSIWKKEFWTAKPGTKYQLELERNGKRIVLPVMLEEIFPINGGQRMQIKDEGRTRP